jgi:hypothetical protein
MSKIALLLLVDMTVHKYRNIEPAVKPTGLSFYKFSVNCPRMLQKNRLNLYCSNMDFLSNTYELIRTAVARDNSMLIEKNNSTDSNSRDCFDFDGRETRLDKHMCQKPSS